MRVTLFDYISTFVKNSSLLSTGVGYFGSQLMLLWQIQGKNVLKKLDTLFPW